LYPQPKDYVYKRIEHLAIFLELQAFLDCWYVLRLPENRIRYAGAERWSLDLMVSYAIISGEKVLD
jgi:hypothetical protein